MNMTVRKINSIMLDDLLAGLLEQAVVTHCAISGLALDSRQVKAGDLFIACRGTHVHGVHYIRAAIKAGAVAVVWEEQGLDEGDNIVQLIPENSGIPIIKLANLRESCGLIASRYYADPSKKLSMIGITGTDGKTSCAQFIAQALNQAKITTGIMGTLGYGMPDHIITASHTTPDAIQVQQLISDMQKQQAQVVVMEASSHGLDQGRVSGVHFNTALLTNLSRDHLDYHLTVEAYADAKRKLFTSPGLKNVILNIDDSFGQMLATQLTNDRSKKINVIGYSLEPSVAASQEIPVITLTELRLLPTGMNLHIESPWGRASVNTSLMGHFNASNLLATLAALTSQGVSFRAAAEILETIETVPGRMESFVGHMDQPRVIVDYAHTPDALRQVLIALRKHGPNKLWCVFGCGGDRDQGKRPLMGRAAQELADYVTITDDNPRTEPAEVIVEHIMQGLTPASNITVEHNRATAISKAIAAASAGDLVLIAGKGHETMQVIGEKQLPFSDRDYVTQCLRGW
ncbi:UDP-N-acetylmuramoylalanyl-D-glutamate--2,6-diaminopimelate ligase [hydrothermal vent metagenome]|uniref:UDP-N-acetylmuramoylalanyl-D-glutamate--2,6-diaminopimelate ligase n=1 Tax=hydrothermal vent metagenome TaxID=652676 RepID=A0A3B0YV54_9ZZZZ